MALAISTEDRAEAMHRNQDERRHEEDLARATRESLHLSLRDTVDAFRILPRAGHGGPPLRYDDGTLPPGIDIIAEATFVVQEDDDVEERIALAVAEASSVHDAECERRDNNGDAVSSQYGTAIATDSNNDNSRHDRMGGGGDENEEKMVEAQPLNNYSVYACSHYIMFKRWYLFLLAAAVIVIIPVISVPAAVVRTNDKNAEDLLNRKLDWTREQIKSIVSPSVSHSFLLALTDSPQSRAIDWLTDGGAHIVTGPNVSSVEWQIRQLYVLAVLYHSTNGAISALPCDKEGCASSPPRQEGRQEKGPRRNDREASWG